MNIMTNELSNSIISDKEDKKSKKSDNCQELKNIAYKTMLLNGTDINPKYNNESNNNLKISNFLESESSANKKETWSKLDKTQKIKYLNRNNKNVVKVRVKMDKNKKGFAKDFFRESSSSNHLYHHIGIYIYTSYSLRKFISLSQTTNEKNRKLEQMRALDNKLKIKVALTNHEPFSVDTLSDLRKIRYFLKMKQNK